MSCTWHADVSEALTQTVISNNNQGLKESISCFGMTYMKQARNLKINNQETFLLLMTLRESKREEEKKGNLVHKNKGHEQKVIIKKKKNERTK